VPPCLPLVAERQRQNRPDRCLQHQPAHLPLQLPLRIDQALLLQLARATRHLRAAWSFTHFPMGPENQAAVRQAPAKGLVVNASTESRSVAAALRLQALIEEHALDPGAAPDALNPPEGRGLLPRFLRQAGCSTGVIGSKVSIVLVSPIWE
ncbi:MAG: hypothetical protein ACK5R2_01720, partial [Cyanobacteriota bacterium]